MRRKLYDCVTTIFACVWVLWKLDRIDIAKRREELANVCLCQRCKVANQSTDIDPIVLLPLLVLITRCQSVAERRNLILFSPEVIKLISVRFLIGYLLFVFVGGSDTVLFSLRRVNHDGLAANLLITHSERHEYRLWRVEFHVSDSNKNIQGLGTHGFIG